MCNILYMIHACTLEVGEKKLQYFLIGFPKKTGLVGVYHQQLGVSKNNGTPKWMDV